MTQSPEKAEAPKKTSQEVREETHKKLEEAKAKTVPELFQKLLKDYKDLSSKERMQRIGQIILAATLGKFLPVKAEKEEAEAQTAEKSGTEKPKTEKEEKKEKAPEKNESIGDKIARIARKYIGVVKDEFRSADVKGGTLACAKVATTILKDAGLTDTIALGVSAAYTKLTQEGWKEVKGKPKPGDVIIWAPTGGYIKDPEGAVVSKGHRHIGIALNAERCVSNSSREKKPREHKIFTKRPVEKILRAPERMAA